MCQKRADENINTKFKYFSGLDFSPAIDEQISAFAEHWLHNNTFHAQVSEATGNKYSSTIINTVICC
jgi:hypothetical protein